MSVRTLSHTRTAEKLGAGGKVELSPAASGLFEAQRVGVALGPGYPIGLVGIGLLVALDRLEIPISMISGTSVGAVIGALYAAGAPAREIRSWVIDNFANEGVDSPTPGGLELHHFGRTRAEKLLASLVRVSGSDPEFYELMIPLFIVAADKISQRPVIFRHGRVFDAVGASLANPVVMSKRRLGEMVLADGAVFSPLPTNVLYTEGSDLVIGIQAKPIRSEKRRSLPIRTKLKPHLLRLLGWATRPEIYFATPPCDILLRPRVPHELAGRSARVREIIDLGEEIAYEALARVEQSGIQGRSGSRRAHLPRGDGTPSGVDSEVSRRISDIATCLREADVRTAGMTDGELMEEFPRFAESLRQALDEISAKHTDPEAATEVLKSSLGDLPELVNQSPFMDRALKKPRGYAGDDRLLNYVYGDEVLAAPTNMGKLLNYAFFSSPAANAIRNRAKIVQGVIFDRLSQKTPLHVTSIASGPAHEVSTMTRLLPRDSPKSQIIWTMLDQDQKALDNAREAVPAGVIEPRFLLASLWDIVKGRVELVDQDVVYSLGLFDYLEQRTAIEVVKYLYGCLAPGGLMLIGNFHPRNPYRALMEGAADWFLIHRTEDELLRIGKQGAPEGRHFVMAEPEGVNLILVTSKPLAAGV
ncbi:MAG: patatin-like phospholipase family protein [Thermoanaerobaculia bacterium]